MKTNYSIGITSLTTAHNNTVYKQRQGAVINNSQIKELLKVLCLEIENHSLETKALALEEIKKLGTTLQEIEKGGKDSLGNDRFQLNILKTSDAKGNYRFAELSTGPKEEDKSSIVIYNSTFSEYGPLTNLQKANAHLGLVKEWQEEDIVKPRESEKNDNFFKKIFGRFK